MAGSNLNPYQARPTLYRGIQMRSRLEATAAGLLDEVGVEWTYEPICFADGRDQYLPDFQLWPSDEQLRMYLEIKPESLWEGIDSMTDGALEAALTRMKIITASYPRALLVLWMPTLACPCGGRLMWFTDGVTDGWEIERSLDFFITAVEHRLGEHSALEPLMIESGEVATDV
jgi:hypothetical protein